MTSKFNLTINARPTKTFFIDMLTKDIPLIRTIIDLVDNCVDGAHRLRPDGNYDGLWVRIQVEEDLFRIADNCGGIPADLARHYAFRFGRSDEVESISPSIIGQFGVGMKRAFFKLGGNFRVESTAEESHFIIEEDVDEWKKKKEWEFIFDELEENLPEIPPERRGTIITVTTLREIVSDSFKLENFQTRLIQQLETAHQMRIDAGLAISLNGIPLQSRPLKLLQSNHLKPVYRDMTIEVEENGRQRPSSIAVKIYAGLSESKPRDAGWCVFCNGRMLLEHDQSITTGWGEGGGKKIPKYHNQFARFRGYTFFDSDDVGLLPWNTTKTGVDDDSPVFRAVRLEMVQLMRPVIDFLNKLDAEKGKEERDDRLLEAAVKAAKPVRLLQVRPRDTFLAPKPKPTPRVPRTGRIQYSKPLDQIDVVKRVLKVRSFKEVGERTFEYFWEMECED